MDSYSTKRICDLCDANQEDGHEPWCPEYKEPAVAPPVQPENEIVEYDGMENHSSYPGKQEGEGKEFKQLLKRFVTDFALMIQPGENIRKLYEHYEKGNSLSIEKLMLLALPAQQIAGDKNKEGWIITLEVLKTISEKIKLDGCTDKCEELLKHLKSLSYKQPGLPSTTEGYSREFVQGFAEWITDRNTPDTFLKKIGDVWYWRVDKHGSTKYTFDELLTEYSKQLKDKA